MEAARALAVRSAIGTAKCSRWNRRVCCSSFCDRYAEAEPLLERGLALAEAIGARRYQSILLAGLAEARARTGARRRGARADRARARAVARNRACASAGRWLLGLKARMHDDPREREQCRAEAEALLAQGCVGHNHDRLSPPRHRGCARARRMGARPRTRRRARGLHARRAAALQRFPDRPRARPHRARVAPGRIGRCARSSRGCAPRPSASGGRSAGRRRWTFPADAAQRSAASRRDQPPRMAELLPLRPFLREQIVGQRMRGEPAPRDAETDATPDLESHAAAAAMVERA